MTHSKKICIAVTVGTMLAALCTTSCSQEKNAEPKTTSVSEKPESMTLMVDGTFLKPENGQQILVDGFKKIMGMDLIINQPAHNEYPKKVNLAFTTGDIPDVILLNNVLYNQYAEHGALYDLTDLYEKSEIKKHIKDPAIIDALKIHGRLYGLPCDRGNGTITYVRGDWLEKLGLSVPKTYDEFINMLREFKNHNPDGLSPDQVIPLTAAGLINTEYPYDIYLREFYQDARPDIYKVNGKWVDGLLQPNMKQALTRMRDAYKEGLIDKEIITNKTSTCRNKFFSGVVGVFNYWAGTWTQTLVKNLTANFPDAKVVPIPALEGIKYIERTSPAIAITSKAKNPEGLFKYFFEKAFDCGEGQKFLTFGVEGKTYKINENGKIQFLPSVEDPKKPFVKSWFSPELPVTTYDENWDEDPAIKNSLDMFQSTSVIYPLPPSSETFSKLEPELKTIRSSYITKIVYGSLSIDDGLAQYKKDSSKYVQAILDDLNKSK